MTTDFNPNNKTIMKMQSTMDEFVQATITGNLLEVPGIGPAAVAKLSASMTVLKNSDGTEVTVGGVTSTFGLIGVYLSFKNDTNEDGSPRDVPPVELAQKFYNWLAFIGVGGGSRGQIVHAIASKAAIAYPGIYDVSHYGDPAET